jgi:cation diffusion facilitator CzcD-associated flavoprotein CzcO
VIRSYDALIVGAGPAGLATSRELSRAGVQHVVLERGDQIGETWANLYDNLVLHTAKRLSALPGLGFPASTPRFPTRRDFLAYLHRYADTFRVPVETHAEVASLHRVDGAWIARATTGAEVQTRAVVVATGIVANPHIPEIPGRNRFGGRVLHSVEYRRPEGFSGQRVLVVGAGNSAGEISAELACAGADVTLAVRTGAVVVPREIAGIPIQYFGVALASLPRGVQRMAVAMMGRAASLVRGPAVLPRPTAANCPNVPLIGFHLADLLRAGTIRLKGGLAEFTTGGVRFSDDSEQPFDAVILATGYRAAVGMLRDLIHVDDCGFASRRDRVVSVDQPGLYFVGHNYDIRGGLFNIGRDGRLAAGWIRSAVRRDRSRTSTGTRPRLSER